MKVLLKEGSRVNKYEIINCLHSDSHGAVYQIKDEKGIKKALKEIIPRGTVSPRIEEIFTARVERLKGINHTNLIKIEDFFTEKSCYYMVMTLIKGKTLKEVFEEKYKDSAAPVKFVLNYMVKVCSVLKYLHQLKPEPLVFGSLTPSSIIVSSSGQIKLFNYGMSSMIITGTLKGKGGFYAPEQSLSGTVNIKTDIFSLGAILYYMLTGDNPEKSPMNFKNIGDINGEVPDYLEQVIHFSLKENADERPDLEDISQILVKSYVGTAASSPGMSKKTLKEDKKEVIDKNIFDDDLISISEEIPPDEIEEKSEEIPPDEIEEKIDKTPGFFDLQEDFSETDFSETENISEDVTECSETEFSETKNIAEEVTECSETEFSETENIAEEVTECSETEFSETENISEEVTECSETENISEDLKINEFSETSEEIPQIQETKEEVPIPDKYSKDKIEDKKSSIEELRERLKSAPKRSAGDFRKIKDAKSITAFLRAKAKGETDVTGEETKIESVSQTEEELLDFSTMAPFRGPSSPPVLELYEEIDVLNKRYEVSEILNKHAYGADYLVQDYDEKEEEKTQKIVREIQYRDSDGNMTVIKDIADKFMEKIQSLKKTDHPGLVKIFDYFYVIHDDPAAIRLFVVTEYLEGLTFEELLETYKSSGKTMPAKTLFGLVPKICDILIHLHSKTEPVFLGEIKPGDLMLTNSGEVKILRYGLAGLFRGTGDEVNPMRGTLGYSAPERLKYGELNSKSDIFSLGTTMYYMLTSKNLEETPYDFPPLRKFNPFLSPKVERLVSMCINVNQSQRPGPEQVKNIIENIDFFEIDKESVKKKAPEEEEIIPEKSATSTQKLVKEKVTTAVWEFRKENPILNNRLFQAVMALVMLIIITGTGYFIMSLLPKKERSPVILYGLKDSKIIGTLDLKTCNISTVDLDQQITGAVYSDITGYIYAISGDKLLELSQGSNKVRRETSLGREPSHIILSYNQKIAYISNKRSNNVSVIDLNNFKNVTQPVLVGAGPTACALSHNKGDTVAVINSFQQTVSFINTDDNVVTGTAAVDEDPRNLSFNSDNSKFYVVHRSIDKVYIGDSNSKKILNKLSLPSGPVDVTSDIVGEQVYIITEKSGDLVIINTVNDSIRDKIKLDFSPLKMVINPYGKKIFIGGSKKDGTYGLWEYDIINNKITSLSDLEKEPSFLFPVYFLK